MYGAAALAAVDQDTADRSLQEALDAGVNHLDVAASYGDAELRLGAEMPRIRASVFLATKTGERDAESARRSLERSLQRLQTDRVDLLQLHAVGDLAELDRVTAPGGALEAAVQAVEEGLVGAVGITGHGDAAAATHLEALRRFPFATVLAPLNPVLLRDQGWRAAYDALVDEVRRQDAGLLTIKTLARRNWPGVPAGAVRGEQRYATWYEPFDDAERIRAATSSVLARPEVTGLATAGDVRLLAAQIAAEADRMPAEQAEQVLAGDRDYSSPFLAIPA